VWPMAWRWRQLLRARGIDDRMSWLVRAYFTAYTAGQVLPTSIGGDAMRIYETSRRHPGHTGSVAGTVLLERAPGGAATLTLAVPALRVLAIWCAGKGVGVGLSPRAYYVMGPLLFLVLLVPFTINGIAVRESFFVSFLGGLGVDPSRAFATGFLFFVVTIALSVPGAVVLGWESLRGSSREAPASPGAPQPTTRPQS